MKHDLHKKIGSISAEKISLAVKITLALIIAVVVMQAFDINITGLVAFGGIGGIVVGFAARDLLANFFGALMLYFDKPFLVGDAIRSPDRQIEGTVEHIGWRTTYVRTSDKRLLYIPNSIFSTIVVENISRSISKRINETIKLRLSDIDKIEKIISEIRESLKKHPDIDQSQGFMVYLSNITQNAPEFFVECYTYTKNHSEFCAIKQDILLKVSKIIKENGAEIASQTFN